MLAANGLKVAVHGRDEAKIDDVVDKIDSKRIGEQDPEAKQSNAKEQPS